MVYLLSRRKPRWVHPLMFVAAPFLIFLGTFLLGFGYVRGYASPENPCRQELVGMFTHNIYIDEKCVELALLMYERGN